MDKIKVVVVEDDPGWLKAMVSFINNQDDMVIVGTATNKEVAITVARTISADVILMDINLNGNKLDGIYAAAEILLEIKTKIIMLTSLREEEVISDAFAAGAVHFVSKDEYEEIPKVIRSIHGNVFSPVGILAKHYAQLKREEQLKALTPSEKQVLEMIEQGYTQSQIQSKLVKTKNTLKTQIKNILSKLNVGNTKEAVKKVKSGGIVKPKDETNKD